MFKCSYHVAHSNKCLMYINSQDLPDGTNLAYGKDIWCETHYAMYTKCFQGKISIMCTHKRHKTAETKLFNA